MVAAPEYVQHLVVLCEIKEEIKENIETRMKDVKCLNLSSTEKKIAQRYEEYTIQLFDEIQRVLKEKQNGKILVQIAFEGSGEKEIFLGLSGLMKTAQVENPKLLFQIIMFDNVEDTKGMIDKLIDNSRSPYDREIRYKGSQRLVNELEEIKTIGEKVDIPWKENGVYLIAGGIGGLGLIFAGEIARKAKNTVIILTGRSVLSDEKWKKLKEIEEIGCRIEYRQMDVVERKAVNQVVQDIIKKYGSLNGIIHCAGVIRDNYIIKKTREEVKEVLIAKVKGLINLDEASKHMPLDLFIMFSSISVLGNAGQADYAAANAFMDCYAKYRNILIKKKERQGRTLSINWPLWKEGGMQMKPEMKEMLQQSFGMMALETQKGILALYQCFKSNRSHVIVMEGDIAKFKQNILKEETQTKASGLTKEAERQINIEQMQSVMKTILSVMLKVEETEMEIDTDLKEYGLDAVILSKLAEKLSQEFNCQFNSAEFIGKNTIKRMVNYLSKKLQHKESTHKEEESGEIIREKAVNYFKRQLSAALKLSPDKIGADEPLEKYGIDSIIVMQMTNHLEKVFGSLSKTLFFEYNNIRELSGYFLDYFREKMIALLSMEREKTEGDKKGGIGT